MNREEELYDTHRSRILELEREMEEIQWRKRDLGREKEESRELQKEEWKFVEALLDMWGDCEDSARIRCCSLDFAEEEKRELEQEEQELTEEYSRIVRAREQEDEDYRTALSRMGEEEMEWPE